MEETKNDDGRNGKEEKHGHVDQRTMYGVEEGETWIL